jgi:uncharacterized integral membrane protein
MSSLKLIAALLAATVLVVFGAQNTQAVTLHFLMFKVPSMPMVFALFAAVVLGALLGWIVSAPGRFRGMHERRGLRGQVEAQAAAAQDHTLLPVAGTSTTDTGLRERIPHRLRKGLQHGDTHPRHPD